MKLVFFGSFQHYSALILDALIKTPELEIMGVVTTPPNPQGRQKVLTQNPVHQLADQHRIPIYTPTSLGRPQGIAPTPPQYFVTAGYGKLLPSAWLAYPTQGALNLHFSLLPKFRGANPAEWAILLGETETGVSLIKMSDKFDQGDILFQKRIELNSNETRETLYQKLYELGAQVLPQWMLKWQDFTARSQKQPPLSPTPDALRFTRQDGFIDWQIIQAVIGGQSFNPNLLTGHLKVAADYLKIYNTVFIERAARALSGFPSLWTQVKTNKGNKRLKLISFTPPNRLPFQPLLVQLEGLPITPYNQIKNQIL